MAFRFASGSTDRVVHNNTGGIFTNIVGSADGITVSAWVKRSANGANQTIMTKDENLDGFILLCDNGTVEGELRMLVWRATTNSDYITTASVMPIGVWTFVAATYNENDTPTTHLFVGSETSWAREITDFSLAQDGSGASDGLASDIVVGNLERTSYGHPFIGDIDHPRLLRDRTVTPSEIREMQVNTGVTNDGVGWRIYSDYNRLGKQYNQIKFDIERASGTVTGAKLVRGPDIQLLQENQGWMLPFVSAAGPADPITHAPYLSLLGVGS